MNARFFFSIVIWIYAAFANSVFAQNNPIEDMVVRLLTPGGRKADLSMITPENSGGAITLLREIATGKRREIGREMPSRTGAQIVLLRLADPETVERAIAGYQLNYGTRFGFHIAEDLSWSEQAAIIPHLAGDFFLNDGDKSTLRLTGDPIGIMVPPRSAFSAFTSLKIVAASQQFSPEMREWAQKRRNAGIYPFTAFRDEMRVWWRQNETAFKTGNYLAVTPPAPEPPPALPNPEDSKRVIPVKPSAKLTPVPPTPTPFSAPTPISANTDTPAAPAAPAAHWALWTGLVAILTAISGWLLHRAKKGRRR